jgi:hypothetical protein
VWIESTSFFFFFAVLGFEPWAFSTCQAGALLLEPCLQPFCSGYSGDKVSLFLMLAFTLILLFYASCHSWVDRDMSACSAICWDSVLWTVCAGWPQTLILPILASQVARIAGLSHWRPTWVSIF